MYVTCLPLAQITGKATAGGIYVEGIVNGVSSNDDAGTKAFSTSAIAIANITETTFDFAPRSASYPLKAGDYFWVAIYY